MANFDYPSNVLEPHDSETKMATEEDSGSWQMNMKSDTSSYVSSNEGNDFGSPEVFANTSYMSDGIETGPESMDYFLT
jgi:hypothetical protein